MVQRPAVAPTLAQQYLPPIACKGHLRWLLPPETFNHENYIVRAKIPCAALTSWSLLGSQRSTGVFCTCQILDPTLPSRSLPDQLPYQPDQLHPILSPNATGFSSLQSTEIIKQVSCPPWEPGGHLTLSSHYKACLSQPYWFTLSGPLCGPAWHAVLFCYSGLCVININCCLTCPSCVWPSHIN